MHNDSVDFVVKSIQKTPLVNLNGLIYQEYQDFFDDIWLERLNFNFDSVKTNKLEKQEKDNRFKVDYSEKISKELNIFFKKTKITKALEEKFNLSLNPDTADIWFDFFGYQLTPHVDDTRIKLALQIYLGDQEQPGTTFYDSTENHNKIHKVLYKKNNGYSLLNNDKSWHSIDSSVISGFRKSIYIRYS
jgi:hypothetical protein